MNDFTEIKIETVNESFFNKIGKQWMLVTAGNKESFNTMTASWGGIGVLWNMNTAFSFIRQSRYTLEFLDKNDYYTLSFFGGKYMKELTFCGRNSGRDTDKIKETGFTPIFPDRPYDTVAFDEAELVLVCRKLYKQAMTGECFVDKSLITNNYSDNDWHEVFVGEIVKAYKKK